LKYCTCHGQAREAAYKQAEENLRTALHTSQSQLDAGEVRKTQLALQLSSVSAELDKTLRALAETSADRASLIRKLAETEQRLAEKLGEADGRQEALSRSSARAAAAEAGKLEAEAKVASLSVELASVTKEYHVRHIPHTTSKSISG
jgi:chromosome segregation ATPase